MPCDLLFWNWCHFPTWLNGVVSASTSQDWLLEMTIQTLTPGLASLALETVCEPYFFHPVSTSPVLIDAETHFLFSHSNAYSVHSLSWSHLNSIPQLLSVHQETCHETSVGHILLTSHFLSLEIGWDFHQNSLSPECFIILIIMHSCIRNFVISGMQSRKQKEKLQHIPECICGCWCFRWFNPWVHY